MLSQQQGDTHDLVLSIGVRIPGVTCECLCPTASCWFAIAKLTRLDMQDLCVIQPAQTCKSAAEALCPLDCIHQMDGNAAPCKQLLDAGLLPAGSMWSGDDLQYKTYGAG